jgi:general transcription factor 3C polypeptide 3 (transcription factor C subunit 4)
LVSENEAVKQAIYCLTKALAVDPTDVDALWDRSFLFKQIDLNKNAVDGFTKILEYMPHHFKVINELAQLYRIEGRTSEAIKLYEDAIAYHTANGDDDMDEDEDDEDEDFNDKLGYSEINMLSELYLILNDYRRSLITIKTGLRIIQKRQNETWWVDRQEDDDDEYLEEDEAKTDFPIELRVRMGICRVYLNQVRIATVSL